MELAPPHTGDSTPGSSPVDVPSKQNTRSLRRADLKSGTLLTLFSLWFLYESSTFPLAESYGGVQSAWYISPALMPLMVGASLLLLSLVLTANAIRFASVSGGISRLLMEGSGQTREYQFRLASVVLYFAGYIYGLIPHVDFVISTLFFLGFFTATFYIDTKPLVRFNTYFFFVASLSVWIIGSSAALEPYIFYPCDIATALLLIVGVAMNIWLLNGDAVLRRKLMRGLGVSCVVTLLICGAFKYGLLVPLPTEGVVVRAMDHVRSLNRN